MADLPGYPDWRALEQAIKDAARRDTHENGSRGASAVDARMRQARFDRSPCRVFAECDQSDWLLKGGMSMLARVRRSRATTDIDLASSSAAEVADAERALTELVAADLGDHLTFRFIQSIPTGLSENQAGVITRRCSFACIDRDDGARVDTLVVLAHTQVIDRAELGRAITHKRVLSAVEPFQHFVIPTAWHQTYAITAKGVVAAESLTAAIAAEVVASMVDPALGPTSPDAT